MVEWAAITIKLPLINKWSVTCLMSINFGDLVVTAFFLNLGYFYSTCTITCMYFLCLMIGLTFFFMLLYYACVHCPNYMTNLCNEQHFTFYFLPCTFYGGIVYFTEQHSMPWCTVYVYLNCIYSQLKFMSWLCGISCCGKSQTWKIKVESQTRPLSA
jgi:hypothetical protein